MYIVIFCSLLALLLTYLDTRGMVKNGMFLGFVLITFLQVVHYDYGNDYMSYYNKYFEITQYDFNLQNILDKELYREPGWAILNYCFKPFGDYGFFMLVAVISTFQGIVIYKSIKKYVPNSQWPYAVFIYLFSTSLYLMEFTMLRQMLVMIIFIALWPLIERRKFVIPLIILYLCSFIHASSIILLPFTFWGFIPMGKYTGKIFTVIYLALFVTLFVYKDLIDEIFSFAQTISEDIESYREIYEEGNRITSFGVGFFLNLIPLCVALQYISGQNNNKSIRLMAALSSISFIILPFGQIIQLIGRVGSYFSVFSIFTIPITYTYLRNNIIRWILISVQVVLLFYSYWEFFKSPVWRESFGGEFNTIFSVIF